MEGLGVLLAVVAAFVANLPALREQWRTDRAGSIKTIWMFGIYLLYIGLGIVVVLLLAPREGGGEDKSVYLSMFIVGFVLYGALTLMRVVPRYREPPAWLMHFGVADLVVLALIFGCLAAYLWA
ncbi:hypothetical protein [Methyloceanibacter sp.]|uniref:hypothetical protein n=1 Tax=Methyloceanibacter sp. TaxID=1965321 RepID=UPI003D6C8480